MRSVGIKVKKTKKQKAEKKAEKTAKKRKLEEEAEVSNKVKLDENTPASIPPAAISDVESGMNIQLPTPHSISTIISDSSSAAWSANFNVSDYDFDDDEADPKETIVDLNKEKDYTSKNYDNAQVEKAQGNSFYQRQFEAEDPIAIILKEYIDVHDKSSDVEMDTRKVRLESMQSIKLLDTKWLSNDIINVYLRFLSDENRQFEMIQQFSSGIASQNYRQSGKQLQVILRTYHNEYSRPLKPKPKSLGSGCCRQWQEDVRSMDWRKARDRE